MSTSDNTKDKPIAILTLNNVGDLSEETIETIGEWALNQLRDLRTNKYRFSKKFTTRLWQFK